MGEGLASRPTSEMQDPGAEQAGGWGASSSLRSGTRSARLGPSLAVGAPCLALHVHLIEFHSSGPEWVRRGLQPAGGRWGGERAELDWDYPGCAWQGGGVRAGESCSDMGLRAKSSVWRWGAPAQKQEWGVSSVTWDCGSQP